MALKVEASLEIETITTVEGLRGLKEAWDSLGSRCPAATIFSTWEWTTALWKHLGNGCHPFVVVVREGPKVVGLAPLALQGKWPMRVARFLAAGPGDYSLSDYGGFLVEGGREGPVLGLILEELLGHSEEWDLLELDEVPARSCLMGPWLDEVDRAGLPFSVERQGVAHPIALPDTWEGYLAGLSANTRQTLERKARKLAREHSVRFERVGEAPDLPGAMRHLFALHTARWGSRGLPGIFPDGQMRRFHLDVASRFLERGWLDLEIMFVDGAAVGAMYNFSYRDTVYFYASGFSPAEQLSAYSLGSLLLGHSIQGAIKRRMATFDLLRGDGEYKARFQPAPSTNYRLRIARTVAQHRLYRGFRKLGRAARFLPIPRGARAT